MNALFWSALFAAGVIGSALATVVLVRSRSAPSLAQVIARAEADSLVGPAPRARGVAE